jgi:hypothetical protein
VQARYNGLVDLAVTPAGPWTLTGVQSLIEGGAGEAVQFVRETASKERDLLESFTKVVKERATLQFLQERCEDRLTSIKDKWGVNVLVRTSYPHAVGPVGRRPPLGVFISGFDIAPAFRAATALVEESIAVSVIEIEDRYFVREEAERRIEDVEDADVVAVVWRPPLPRAGYGPPPTGPRTAKVTVVGFADSDARNALVKSLAEDLNPVTGQVPTRGYPHAE